MGYYTRYALSWQPQPDYKAKPNCEHTPSADAKFCPVCGKPTMPKELDALIVKYITGTPMSEMSFALQSNGDTHPETKWYAWFEDMLKMSAEIPNVLFKLHGEGEENGDIWDAYFLNGKGQHHRAEIVIKPCDPQAWTTTKPR